MSNGTVVNREAVETVKDIIKDIETAMFSTISEGRINSRPMQTQDIEFDGDLWFLTKRTPANIKKLWLIPTSISLMSANPMYRFGERPAVDDLERKKALWNAAYEKFLQTSYDDPNIILIKVDTDTAEYWETGNKTKTVKAFFKKMVGQEPEGDSDINKTVDLH